MLRSQRIALMAGLLVIAALLHINACQWHWRTLGYPYFPESSRLVMFWTEDPAPDAPVTNNGLIAVRYTALFSDRGAGPLTAIVVGIAVPFGLLLAVGCLALGWRARERITRGLCPSCGYDLRAQAAPLQYPECGWKRS